MRREGRRRAFTLVEVVVALAVILILAAVAVPQLGGYLDQKRVAETKVQLELIRDALYGPSTSFYTVVTAHAGALSQLSTPITTSDRDACNAFFTGGDVNRWDDQGPYVNFMITANGMATPIGQARNALTRLGSGVTRQLRITIDDAPLADAQALDELVDGTAGAASGTVQYTALPDNLADVHYDVVINAAC